MHFRLASPAVLAWCLGVVTIGCSASPPENPPPPVAGAPAGAPPPPPPAPGSPPAKPPAGFEGYHDIGNCAGLVGWAWDSRRPNEPIRVDVFAGDEKLATVTADVSRPDLVGAKKGDGRHGFTMATPERLKDGAPHRIFVTYSDTAIGLANSPKQITCTKK